MEQRWPEAEAYTRIMDVEILRKRDGTHSKATDQVVAYHHARDVVASLIWLRSERCRKRAGHRLVDHGNHKENYRYTYAAEETELRAMLVEVTLTRAGFVVFEPNSGIQLVPARSHAGSYYNPRPSPRATNGARELDGIRQLDSSTGLIPRRVLTNPPTVEGFGV